MFTNRILDILLTISAFITVPLQLVTTFILGLLVTITFGLLLFPLSFVWAVLFYFPLIGISYTWEKVKLLRWLASIIGLPLAFIGDIYTSLIPSMGEMESRSSKLLFCETYPYSWRFNQFQNGKINIESDNELYKVFKRLSKDNNIREYINLLYKQRNNSISKET